MNDMLLNELYNKIIDLDLSEYTHQKLYDLCFKLDDKIEELRNKLNEKRLRVQLSLRKRHRKLATEPQLRIRLHFVLLPERLARCALHLRHSIQ